MVFFEILFKFWEYAKYLLFLQALEINLVIGHFMLGLHIATMEVLGIVMLLYKWKLKDNQLKHGMDK